MRRYYYSMIGKKVSQWLFMGLLLLSVFAIATPTVKNATPAHQEQVARETDHSLSRRTCAFKHSHSVVCTPSDRSSVLQRQLIIRRHGEEVATRLVQNLQTLQSFVKPVLLILPTLLSRNADHFLSAVAG